MPWHAHKHTPHTHADPFKSLTLVTMHQRHIVYLSNQANSCTTEKHGSHFSFAQCPFELLSFFIKSFLFHLFFPLSSCFVLHLFFPYNYLKIKEYVQINILFMSKLNGFGERRRNRRKCSGISNFPMPHSALTLWSSHNCHLTFAQTSSSGHP